MKIESMGRTPMEVDGKRMGGKRTGRTTIVRKASAALRDSDFSGLLESATADDVDCEVTAALKSVLAQRAAEYTLRASRIAKRRGMRLSAATIIIAAESK